MLSRLWRFLEGDASRRAHVAQVLADQEFAEALQAEEYGKEPTPPQNFLASDTSPANRTAPVPPAFPLLFPSSASSSTASPSTGTGELGLQVEAGSSSQSDMLAQDFLFAQRLQEELFNSDDIFLPSSTLSTLPTPVDTPQPTILPYVLQTLPPSSPGAEATDTTTVQSHPPTVSPEPADGPSNVPTASIQDDPRPAPEDRVSTFISTLQQLRGRRRTNSSRITENQVQGTTATTPSGTVGTYEHLQSLVERLGHVSRGATADEIADLPTQLFDSSFSRNHGNALENCTICMEAFKDGDVLKRLPCLHLFCDGCINEWLRRSKECPVCKCSIQTAAS